MQVTIPHQNDIHDLIKRYKQLTSKPNPTKEDRKAISSFRISHEYLENEYVDWTIVQSTFDEMCFLAFEKAVKEINNSYQLSDPDLVKTFHDSYELYEYQKFCFNYLIEQGIDIFGEFPHYEEYHNNSKKDLFEAIEPYVQIELLKQGLQI